LVLLFNPDDGGDMFLRNGVIFNGLHVVMSQKLKFFIAPAARTTERRLVMPSPFPEAEERLTNL
jgi:hypothetical protein